MNIPNRKIGVHIKENAPLARFAARKLKSDRIAIVIRKTIYLHHTSKAQFTSNRRWLLHELMHVEQFQRHGFLRFIMLYLLEYLKKGYYHNRFEAEARAAEDDEHLLSHYEII